MKIKIFTSLIILSFLFGGNAFSQLNCGTDQYHKNAIKKYPNILENERQFKELLQNSQLFQNSEQMRSSSNDVVYTIPIVFHILHNYGPENISDAQIFDEMEQLNKTFNKLNASLADVIPPFVPLVGNVKIQFRLAQKDPAGNCTNGIDRIATTKTYQSDDNAKLNLWDPRRYLNVWVANTIGANGVAGYSNYPSTVNNNPLSEKDGVILLHDYVGTIGTSQPSHNNTLTHEIGHYLSLPHTWGGTNEPGVACGDDGVPDTPETEGHTSCSPLYDYICSVNPIESPALAAIYLFNNVSSSSGNSDTLGIPNVNGLNFSSFKASNDLSTNSLSSGQFEFSNWGIGAANNETSFANLNGNVNTSKYYEFTINPSLPYAMKITGVSFTVGRNASGPRTFVVRSSANNYATNLPILFGSTDTNFINNMTSEANNVVFLKDDAARKFLFRRINLTGAPFSLLKDNNSITFRIYAYNAEDIDGSFIVDNVRLLGDYGKVENIQNYMEYSYCSNMFTLAQAAQMRLVLTQALAQRNVLVSDSNLVFTGVNSPAPCAPKADFTTNRRFTCVGDPVVFKNTSYNGTPTTFSWSFPGGTPSSSTSENPSVTFASHGWKEVSLTVSNLQGTSSVTKMAVYIALDEPYYYADYNATSFTEPFEDVNAMERWISYNPDNNASQFKRIKLNDGSENHCLVLENFGQGKDKDVLISPSVDLKFRTNIKLNFRISGSTTQSVATAEDLALIQDSLKIYFSKNCGDSWSTSNPISSFNTPKADLITGGPWTIPYRASNNVGWKQMTVNVPTNMYDSNVRAMFRFSAGGTNTNNFYIDDINYSFVTNFVDVPENGNWNLYPNPYYSVGEPLSITTDLNLDNAMVTITDALGREVSSEKLTFVAGANNNLNTDVLNTQARGIYFVKVSKNNETKANFKFIKNF
jgi:PKD repeat protein